MKIVTVVGARPQFIKAAVISRAIADYHRHAPEQSSRVREIMVHTGQHFDEGMSQIFFEELEIPQPHYNLGIGGNSHGAMTGRMLEEIERVLLEEKPDWVLVYGDTNSTLAGALAAAKLHIPIAHVEAGLRSFNRCMPEEINRLLTDHAASLLFCPTAKAVANLKREGFENFLDLSPGEGKVSAAAVLTGRIESNRVQSTLLPLVCKVGDVMYDAALHYGPKAEGVSKILEKLRLQPRDYALATVHREENTDNPERLRNIFSGLAQVARDLPVVLPVHPRTCKALEQEGIATKAIRNLILLDPVGYLDMIRLEKNARVIITDSGGVQKEAFFYGVPCVTLRRETEWVELVELGWNRLVDVDPPAIFQAVTAMGQPRNALPEATEKIYGKGEAGKIILQVLLEA